MSITSEVDPRYSDAAARATSWPETLARLASAGVAWIVSVRPDGVPHATPMVPVVDDERVYFHTGTREVKYDNISNNPHVLVLAGGTEWEHGLDVVFEGVAVPVRETEDLARLAGAWARQWDGRWHLEVHNGAVVVPDAPGAPDLEVFEVRPDRAYAYAKGPVFSHTRHRFPGHGDPDHSNDHGSERTRRNDR
jgi:general stress protein 26